MMDGRIIQCGKPEEFYHRPVSLESAAFFGWKNALKGKKNGNSVECALGTFEIESAEELSGDVYLMIHPQAAVCSDDGAYEGTVKEAAYLGTVSDYILDCNGLELHLQVSSRNMYIEGEKIRFDLDRNMMYPVPFVVEEPVKEQPAEEKKKALALFRKK